MSLPTKQDRVGWYGGQTWYTIHGDMGSDLAPVVIIHGGPGMTHDYLLDFVGLGKDRCVLFYDQVGNGRSKPVGEEATAIASLDSIVDELEAVLSTLTRYPGYVLLGHSAGGCVALEHALRKPPGLRGLILANAFPSGAMMQNGLRQLRDGLDPATRAALGGPRDSGEFAHAMGSFFSEHVCRVPPPPHLLRTLEASQRLPQMQNKLMGPDLFNWEGPLSNWSVTADLERISVPTLVYGGLYDETGPECQEALTAGIPKCEFALFRGSSHLPHIEETMACLSRVQSFLTQIDRSGNNATIANNAGI